MSAEALIQQALSDYRNTWQAYEAAIGDSAEAKAAATYARACHELGEQCLLKAIEGLRREHHAAQMLRSAISDLLAARDKLGTPEIGEAKHYLESATRLVRKANNLLNDSPRA
jgi:hypothetical protein